MADSIGVLADMGARLESGFRTAVDITDRIPYTSESLKFEFQRLEQEALLGVAGKYNSDQGVKFASGDVNVDMVYTTEVGAVFLSADQFLYWAMGTATWDTDRSNQLTLQDDLARFGTIAIDKQVTIWEAISCYVKSMTLSCETTGFMKGVFTFQPYNMIITGAKNEAAEFTALPNVEPNRCIGTDSIFYIASDFSDALATGDKIGISNWSLSLDNKLTDDEYTTVEASGHTTNTFPIQPVRNGFREVKFEFTLPRYAADTYITGKVNNTPFQAKIVFTDPSDSDNQVIIYMPHLRINECSPTIDGPGITPITVSCSCFLADTTYDVMDFDDAATAVVKEFGIEIMSDATTGRSAVIS